jgi:Fe-Mn family superoxide dismutase
MPVELPRLPYALNGLEPHMSRETLEFHYGKHHRKYVDEANRLLKGTEYENSEIEEIIQAASGALFNNVAQAWNHAFFWNCLSPGGSRPDTTLTEALSEHFGSVGDFTRQFTQTAVTLFGSGWVWLVMNDDGKLRIEQTTNADTPVRRGKSPLLACDVWEHAYYLDHRHSRPAYLEAYWKLVNWEFVAGHYARVAAAAGTATA